MEVQYKSLEFLGLPGYRVGNDGSVWSKRIRGHSNGEGEKWKPLKLINSHGYRVVHLGYGGIHKLYPVHRLVLESFVGPCPPDQEGCHNDGNRQNNVVSNLRWDAHRANIYDCFPGSWDEKKVKVKREEEAAKIPECLKSGRLVQELLTKQFGEIEIWKNVPGFESLYQVSNYGGFKSLKQERELRRVLGPYERYKIKGLYRDGLVREVGLHRLILETFVGVSPIAGMLACHNDGDRSNNKLSNLRWDTPKGNSSDMVLHGKSLIGNKNHNCKANPSLIKEIRKRYGEGFSTSEIGKQLNLKRQFVYNVAKKLTWAWVA